VFHVPVTFVLIVAESYATLGSGRAHVDDDHVGALVGQPQRVRPALPARRPGNQSDLASDPVPMPSLPRHSITLSNFPAE
jgi:hypothetical protein